MITKEKIYEIEHNMLLDQSVWEATEVSNGYVVHFILGANEMARKICEAIERDEST